MALFSSPRSNSPRHTPPGMSVVDAHAVVRGDIETDGGLRVDGRMEGSVLRADAVVVGGTGTILGDITAREVVVAGSVTGNILASQRVELQSTAVVTGDIEAGAIMVQEGGAVQGRLAIHPISSIERSASPPPTRARLASAGAYLEDGS